MAPKDWIVLAKACLWGRGGGGGVDYLMWKFDWYEENSQWADKNRNHNIPVTFEILTGFGLYENLQNQLGYTLQIYQQITACATKAWRHLPSKGEKSQDLTKIRQGPEEPYQDFVSCLL